MISRGRELDSADAVFPHFVAENVFNSAHKFNAIFSGANDDIGAHSLVVLRTLFLIL